MNDREDKRPFGAYIRTKRLALDMTQKDLAGRLYVAESTISKWERGLSYPDISMVPDICRELGISEHEFFTACDDERQRAQAREAKLWRRAGKITWWTLAICYAIALVVCFICDLAVFHTLDWFWIVLTALLLAFSLTNLPGLVEKHKLPICLGAATGSLFLLLLACWLYTGGLRAVIGGTAITAVCLVLPWAWWALWWFYGKHLPPLFLAVFSVWIFALLAVIRAFAGGDWLLGLAYPLAALCVAYVWLYFAALYWLPAGPWLKAGVCALLTALALPVVNTAIAALLPGGQVPTWRDYFNWRCLITHENTAGGSWINVLLFALLLGASIVLLAVGAGMEVRRRRKA